MILGTGKTVDSKNGEEILQLAVNISDNCHLAALRYIARLVGHTEKQQDEQGTQPQITIFGLV